VRIGLLAAYAVAVVILLVAVERLVSVSPSLLWEQRAAAPMCDVYRSFIRHIEAYDHEAFVGSGTIPWEDTAALSMSRVFKTSATGNDSAYDAPRKFSRAPDREAKHAQDEEISIDTAPYFGPVTSNRSLFIRDCFSATQPSPSFYDGPFFWLSLREAVLGRGATIWRVSPVGISPDGRHALTYAESFCGSWCMSGSFYLFERRDDAWVLLGARRAFIA